MRTRRQFIDAIRRSHRRDQFPPDATSDPTFEAELVEKYADLFASEQ